MAEKKKKDGMSAGDDSIIIGGNVQGSNIVHGNNNTVSNQSSNIAPLFNEIYRHLEDRTDINPTDKEDVKAELQEIQTALEEPKPDENFITRRFRNIQRMAPDIMDVAIRTLKNPISGVASVIEKISKKMAENTSTAQ